MRDMRLEVPLFLSFAHIPPLPHSRFFVTPMSSHACGDHKIDEMGVDPSLPSSRGVAHGSDTPGGATCLEMTTNAKTKAVLAKRLAAKSSDL